MFGINLKIYASIALIFLLTIGGGYLWIRHLDSKLTATQTELITIKQSYQDDQDLIAKLQNDKKALQQSITQSQTTIDQLQQTSQKQAQEIEKQDLSKMTCTQLWGWMRDEAR